MARIAFRTLWTIEVQHAFFGGACAALAFIVPTATARTLAGAHAMVRVRDGRLIVLIEVDEANAPLAALAGLRLQFGLKPREASFDLITVPLGLPRGDSAVWDNAADPDALAGPRPVRVSGEQLRLAPRAADRPLTMRLFDAGNVQRGQTVLHVGDEAWTLPGLYTRGEWRVEEQAAGPAANWALLVEPDLVGAWGLLGLVVDDGHIAAGNAFTLAFAARSDTLRYYVVANRFGEAEFNQVQVLDAGFNTEARTQILFDRIDAADFDSSHLAPELLDPTGSARIALFEAHTTVTRRARGPGGFELHRNGDVLVGNLPQPGAERCDAQFVVHLSLT